MSDAKKEAAARAAEEIADKLQIQAVGWAIYDKRYECIIETPTMDNTIFGDPQIAAAKLQKMLKGYKPESHVDFEVIPLFTLKEEGK